MEASGYEWEHFYEQQSPADKAVENQADGCLSSLYANLPEPIYCRAKRRRIRFPTEDTSHDGSGENAVSLALQHRY